MNYKQKRNKAGISLYTMAKQLGITEKKYKEVEKRKRPLEGNLVDKFQGIIDNAKQIIFDRSIEMLEIDRWFKEGKAKESLSDYGYSCKELGNEFGVSPAVINKAVNGKDATDDTKEKIYDFLTNPMNKKIKQESKENKKIVARPDIKERMLKLNISQAKLSEILGCSQSQVSYLITGKNTTSSELEKRAYEELAKLEREQDAEPITIEEPVIEEAPVVEETPEIEEKDYKALYEDLTLRYSLLLDESTRAKRQVMLYEKLIEKM